MEIRNARTGEIIPYTLSPISPQALERLDAAVVADNVEMTGYFVDPVQHGVIDGVDVLAGVPDPSLPALTPRFILDTPPSPVVIIPASMLINGVPFLVVAQGQTESIPASADPPAHPALPPGSICETCWDQPATKLLPAPWGGEMGSCIWCAKGEGEEADSTEVVIVGCPAENRYVRGAYLLDILPSGGGYQFSSDGQNWHEHITDCLDGVRYIRNAYVTVSVSSSLA